VRDIQSVKTFPHQHAGGQGLVAIDFGKHTAVPSGRIENLNSDDTCYVAASAAFYGHAITMATCGRRFARSGLLPLVTVPDPLDGVRQELLFGITNAVT